MIVTIHQPSYLPWIPFLEKGLGSDIYVLLDNVQFAKNSEQNRNRIKTAQGARWLTVPVSRSHDTPIREVRIAGRHWQRKHCESIAESYVRAPHYEAVAPELFALVEEASESLLELNLAVDRLFFRWAGFAGRIVLASELDVPGTGSERVLNLCRALGATRYLSGISGADYLEVPTFEAAGIEVLFQQYQHQSYPQLYPKLGFLPRLSALDLFMNLGPGEAAREAILAGSRWAATP